LVLALAWFPEEKCASAFEKEREGKIQMRLSKPLLLTTFGLLFAGACTLITDVDRSKIPDGVAGVATGGDGTQPQGGAADMNASGSPSTTAGSGGTGGAAAGAGGNMTNTAGDNGGGVGGTPADVGGAGGAADMSSAGAGGK
jgi:hypothetical protein